MRRSRLLLGVILLFGIVLAIQPGCSPVPDGWPEKPGLRVVTSFAPIHCFALNVAGEDAAVQCIMSNEGPHGFEPTAQDRVKLERANLFLINGLNLDDDIAEKMIGDLRKKDVKVVRLADAIPVESLFEAGLDRGEGGEHHHGRHDPHVWLGIPEAVLMVERIRDTLVANDQTHAAGYTKRAADYIARLKNLEADGKQMLKDKKERTLVSFHDSLFYFARDFNLEIQDSIEPAPGTEASVKHMSELIEKCRANQIRHITVEPQYPSNTSAQTVLDDLRKAGIDADFIPIDTIETATYNDLKSPDLYESRMRTNLENLAKALK
jgi:ABC-type Zn uptake system ZnuABC Zn-binding protein ZnuA